MLLLGVGGGILARLHAPTRALQPPALQGNFCWHPQGSRTFFSESNSSGILNLGSGLAHMAGPVWEAPALPHTDTHSLKPNKTNVHESTIA